jgi:hypothetical protein
VSLFVVLLVVGVIATLGATWEARRHRLARAVRELGGEIDRGKMHLVREGVVVEVRHFRELAKRRTIGAHNVTTFEISASVKVPIGLRLGLKLRWILRALPPIPQVWTLPIARNDRITLHSDDPDALAVIDGLGDALTRIEERFDGCVLFCDGTRVVCRFAPTPVHDGLSALVDVVVAIARYDRGLSETMLALPDAQPLRGHELDPGVGFPEDGLVLGVRDRECTVAQLDAVPAKPATARVRDGVVDGDVDVTTVELLRNAGNGDLIATSKGARFTWLAIERDRARLLAGVKALRSLRPTDGAYR